MLLDRCMVFDSSPSQAALPSPSVPNPQAQVSKPAVIYLCTSLCQRCRSCCCQVTVCSYRPLLALSAGDGGRYSRLSPVVSDTRHHSRPGAIRAPLRVVRRTRLSSLTGHNASNWPASGARPAGHLRRPVRRAIDPRGAARAASPARRLGPGLARRDQLDIVFGSPGHQPCRLQRAVMPLLARCG